MRRVRWPVRKDHGMPGPRESNLDSAVPVLGNLDGEPIDPAGQLSIVLLDDLNVLEDLESLPFEEKTVSEIPVPRAAASLTGHRPRRSAQASSRAHRCRNPTSNLSLQFG